MYYLNRHQGKRLGFVPQMSTALIYATFDPSKPKMTKQLEVSGMQAICLLAFNEAEEYSHTELKEKTGFNDQELNLQLISLSQLEHKVLLKTSAPEKPAEESQSEEKKPEGQEPEAQSPALKSKIS